MSRSSSRFSAALLASTALSFVAIGPGHAQQDRPVIEEITVTATRREESVYATPINITAVSTSAIEKQGIANIADLARFVPGLTLVDQGARGSSQLIVRGLSVQTAAGSEALGNNNGETVATYIGDVPLYLDIRLMDIERVEVLMGPQGTLYGAGTLGGAIRYIPKRPDPTTASAEAAGKTFMLAHGRGVGFDGYVVGNIPVVADKLAVRALAGYFTDPGFIDYAYLVQTPGVSNPQPDFTNPADVAANLTSKKDGNFEKTFSGRVSVFGQFTDSFDATLSYFYQDTKAGGRQVTHRASFGSGAYESAARVLEPNRRQNNLVTLEANLDLGFATVTSATGLADYDEHGQRDQTDLLLNFEYGYESFPSFTAFTREVADEDRVSQELRVVSSNDSPLTWIVGGFFNYYNVDAISEEYVPGYANFIGANRPDDLEYVELTDQTRKESAGFGEVAYQVTNWWKVTVGGRYYRYSDDTTTGFDLPLASGAPTGINPTLQNNKVKDSGFLYKVNTSFDVLPGVLLYGTVSEGYRLGGVNAVPPCLDPLPPGQNVCALPTEVLIKPDQTLNKEIGIKGAAFDSRMRFSVSVFHINWKDIQTQGRTANGSIPITVNGGKAVSKGVEVSTQLALTNDLSVSATYSYTDAYLTTDAPGLVNGVDAFAGDRVSGSPKHQASAGLDYVRDLGNGYMFGANYNMSYQSNVYTRVGLRNGGEALKPYDLHDVSLSVSTDAWKLGLYVHNLLDRYYVTSVRTERSFIRDVGTFRLRSFQEDIGRPRTIGVEMKYKFGA